VLGSCGCDDGCAKGFGYLDSSQTASTGCGVDEDPATGSAHCILGPLYADKLGADVVRFRQVFPGRGGDIETEVRGDRILLRGRAVTVIESRLRLAP
jgi:predicted PhzF superfamily epimerase YddE/YHI9